METIHSSISSNATAASTPGAKIKSQNQFVLYEVQVLISNLYRDVFDPELCKRNVAFRLRYEQLKQLGEVSNH
jgi:hypothetical protein